MMTVALTLLRKFWPVLLAAAVVVGLGALVLGYGQAEYRRGAASVQAKWDADTTRQRLADTQRALAAEQVNREKEQELRNAAESNARQAEIELAEARRAGAAADAAGQRLRQQVAQLVAAAKARPASGTAGAGAASAGGADAIDLLAQLHSRTDEAAGTIAAVADDARIRGQACERAYDAVTH